MKTTHPSPLGGRHSRRSQEAKIYPERGPTSNPTPPPAETYGTAYRPLAIGRDPETHPSDVPYFVTDIRDTTERTGWSPQRSLEVVVDDVFDWLRTAGPELTRLLRGSQGSRAL